MSDYHQTDYPGLAEGWLPAVVQRPNFIGWARGIGATMQRLATDVLELRVERTLDTATGVYLDQYGRVAGAQRDGRTDDQYRRLIEARIAANLSDGTPDQIAQVLYLLTQPNVEYVIFRRCVGGYTLTTYRDAGSSVAILVRDYTVGPTETITGWEWRGYVFSVTRPIMVTHLFGRGFNEAGPGEDLAQVAIAKFDAATSTVAELMTSQDGFEGGLDPSLEPEGQPCPPALLEPGNFYVIAQMAYGTFLGASYASGRGGLLGTPSSEEIIDEWLLEYVDRPYLFNVPFYNTDPNALIGVTGSLPPTAEPHPDMGFAWMEPEDLDDRTTQTAAAIMREIRPVMQTYDLIEAGSLSFTFDDGPGLDEGLLARSFTNE